MQQCYACEECSPQRLKLCGHCARWSCGRHAESHLYTLEEITVAEVVMCHDCEREGHMLPPDDVVFSAALEELEQLEAQQKRRRPSRQIKALTHRQRKRDS